MREWSRNLSRMLQRLRERGRPVLEAPVPERRALATGAGMLLAGLMLLGWRDGSTLLAWAAVALVLLGGELGVRTLRRLLPSLALATRHRLVDRMPYLLTTLALLLVAGPIALGRMPITQDHAHHYLATRVFVEDLLWNGHLFGWTERIGAGLPFGDVYGTAIYLTTGLLSGLSFGLIPFSFSYCFGILIVWLVPVLTVVAWTRRLCPGWVAPTLAGAAFLFDVGADREGGWVYAMFHGVWPQTFATGMWLLAMLTLLRLAENPRARRLGTAVLVTGFAFWAHPINLLNLMVSLPLLLLVVGVSASRDGQPSFRGVLWLVVACGLAGVLGFVWVSHVLAAAGDLTQHYVYWKSLIEVARDLWSGIPFENANVIVGVLGLVGLVAAVRGRHHHVLTLVLLVAFLVVGTMDVFLDLDLGLWDSNPLIMYRRFATTAKPLWYALAGLGLGTAVHGVAQLGRPHQTSVGLRRVMLCALAPLVWSLLVALPVLVPGPIGRTLTADNAGLAADLDKLRGVLREQRVQLGDRPARVAYWRDGVGDYELIAVADTGFGYVSTERPPCQAYARFNSGRNLDTMRWLGTSVLIARQAQKNPGLESIGRFGQFLAYRVKEHATYPVELKGEGAVEVLRWEPMARRLELRDVDSKSQLILGFPPYRKWHATLNGREVSLQRYDRAGFTFSRLSELEAGVVELAYDDTWYERLAAVAGLLCVLLALVAIFRDRDLPPLGRAQTMKRLVRAGLIALAVLAVVVVILGQVWGDRSAEQHWAARESKAPALRSVLHRTEPLHFRYAPDPYCVRSFSRNARENCNETMLQPHIAAANKRGSNQVPSCLRFGVPDNGWTELTFKLPEGTSLVKGRFNGDNQVRASLTIGAKKHEPRGNSLFRYEVEGNPGEIAARFSNRGKTKTICLELVALGPESADPEPPPVEPNTATSPAAQPPPSTRPVETRPATARPEETRPATAPVKKKR